MFLSELEIDEFYKFQRGSLSSWTAKRIIEYSLTLVALLIMPIIASVFSSEILRSSLIASSAFLTYSSLTAIAISGKIPLLKKRTKLKRKALFLYIGWLSLALLFFALIFLLTTLLFIEDVATDKGYLLFHDVLITFAISGILVALLSPNIARHFMQASNSQGLENNKRKNQLIWIGGTGALGSLAFLLIRLISIVSGAAVNSRNTSLLFVGGLLLAGALLLYSISIYGFSQLILLRRKI